VTRPRYNDGTPDPVQVSPDVATLEVDIVLNPGETPEQAASIVAGDLPGITWQEAPSGNGHPCFVFSGHPEVVRRLQSRYRRLGESKPHLKGKAPVGKGQRRV
jgi:hypothetical protein